MTPTEALSLDSLHHVAIKVESIPRAVAWYREHFRCEVAYEDATWALLRFANISVALVIASEHPPHLGFVSPKAEEYGELKRHRDGTRSIYTTDSEGNIVEIMSEEGT